MTVLIVVQSVVIVLLGLLVVGLLRSHAEILRALHELGVDLEEDGAVDRSTPPRVASGVSEPRTESGAGDIIGTTPFGDTKKLGIVGADHTTLIAFLSSGCLTCADFWESFKRSDRLELPGDDTRLVIVTKGEEAESVSRLADLAPQRVPVVMSTQAWEDYGIPVSPYFVLVDGPSGSVVGEGAGQSWKQVSALLRQSIADTGFVTDRTKRRSAAAGAAERERLADDALAAAGIGPGHPSLNPEPIDQEDDS